MNSVTMVYKNGSTSARPLIALRNAGQHQRGVVLVLALMTLVILTIIGVTAMKGSVLEVRMAGNIQDSTAAFQVAENGIAEVTKDTAGKLKMGQIWSNTYTYSLGSGTTGQADVQTEELPPGPPPEGTDNNNTQDTESEMVNFKITSVGQTDSGTQVTIQQGVKQLKALVQ